MPDDADKIELGTRFLQTDYQFKGLDDSKRVFRYRKPNMERNFVDSETETGRGMLCFSFFLWNSFCFSVVCFPLQTDRRVFFADRLCGGEGGEG
jgi:hypothetical protein